MRQQIAASNGGHLLPLPNHIPSADLVEEHQGQKFLKISATNYAICQLASCLSKSTELHALVQARNDKILECLAAPGDTQEGQELFDSEMPANKGTQKRKAKAMEEAGDKFVVTILLGSTEIPCLVGGQRPTKWDLFVAMEPEPLREVICRLRAGCQIAFAQPSRGYKATKNCSAQKAPKIKITKSHTCHCYNNHQSRKHHYQSTISIDNTFRLMFLNGAAVFTNKGNGTAKKNSNQPRSTISACVCKKPSTEPFSEPAMVEKVAAQVKAMMDGSLAINQKVSQVMDLLEAHGLAHKVVLKPSQILCHPDNRGRTLVSYHDAWTKGMAMLGVGIQISLLQGSIAIEMSKDEAKRKVQVSKNKHCFMKPVATLHLSVARNVPCLFQWSI